MQEMWEAGDRSLGWEDPLEEEMANHSSILAWRIPWTEEPGGLQSSRVEHDLTTQQQMLSLLLLSLYSYVYSFRVACTPSWAPSHSLKRICSVLDEE